MEVPTPIYSSPPPISTLGSFLSILCLFDSLSQKELRALDLGLTLKELAVLWKTKWGEGHGSALVSIPQDQVLGPSLAVRRLQVREELDRSSCGNVLFNGYLPPPGGYSQ